MQRHHVYTFGILLGAGALMVSGLHTWQEALTPQFIGGCLAASAAVLKAMYQDSPNDKDGYADILETPHEGAGESGSAGGGSPR